MLYDIDRMEKFSGAFNLGNPMGTIYDKHIQTAVLTLSVAGLAVPGGTAQIIIESSGDAINVPGSWIKFGGDDISIVAGEENHLAIWYRDADTIYYTNKVLP